jgi:3-methyladenine DNA glycosylase AlkD
MKSAMPYHGLRNAEMRAVCKKVFEDYSADEQRDGDLWQRDVLAIWRGASHREERYAAIELAQRRQARSLHTMAALGTFEELIVTGAWWDYVDAVAGYDLSLILRNEPKPMRRTMLAWAKGDDMWKRRSAILCQLPFKKDTDLELLFQAIEPSLHRKEFWLRKAIGWALRSYAKVDRKAVERYVRLNETRLSPLSQREALLVRGKT